MASPARNFQYQAIREPGFEEQAQLLDRRYAADDAERWLDSAHPVAGSWWTHWSQWLRPHAGEAVPA
jgi:poly(3-hydroxyalkanoate) synthetase